MPKRTFRVSLCKTCTHAGASHMMGYTCLTCYNLYGDRGCKEFVE